MSNCRLHFAALVCLGLVATLAIQASAQKGKPGRHIETIETRLAFTGDKKLAILGDYEMLFGGNTTIKIYDPKSDKHLFLAYPMDGDSSQPFFVEKEGPECQWVLHRYEFEDRKDSTVDQQEYFKVRNGAYRGLTLAVKGNKLTLANVPDHQMRRRVGIIVRHDNLNDGK